jgi:hypothetical protein
VNKQEQCAGLWLKGRRTGISHLACLPDGDTEHFMDQCLMVPLMQVAHASRQGIQDANELLNTVVIAIL